jgi:phosphoadenosine phosphosulfate reductase
LNKEVDVLNNPITYETWDEIEVQAVHADLKDYLDVLKWTYQTYQNDVVYACSFGAEGMVLIDLISKIKKDARIIFLDTDLHFKETYDLIAKVKLRYPSLKIELIKPALTLNEQTKWYGEELWKHNPDLCCQLRKITPLKNALKDVKAWISGVRRDQSLNRQYINYINKDDKFQNIKICPLIYWTWDEIWAYINLNKLPYNELHDKNYPSIGCAPCTSPATGQNLRSGRWVNHDKTECGLHLK